MPAVARTLLMTGALAGALAVALGAFGAHALKARLDADMLSIWQTGVQYHFWHALGILVVGALAFHQPQNGWLPWSGGRSAAGIAVFSGTLYLLALGAPRWVGAITPIGGVAFILGWLALAVAAAKG
jgi:uncharacterized membrane protein YgdD (TMEM256/DUF423 family)